MRASSLARVHRRVGMGAMILLGLLALGAGAPVAVPSPAQDAKAKFLADPLYLYFDARFKEALALSEDALRDEALPGPVKDKVLLTVGTIRLAQNRKPDARAAFLNILSGNPAKDLDEPERLPPPVTRLFYQLRDSLCMVRLQDLVESHRLAANIRTLAIGDLENNSLVKPAFDTDHLSRGLVHALTEDLQNASPLRVVDRQRLSVLLEEQKLAADPSRMEPDTRIRLGQLIGAQSYLFGQYMQLDRDHARIDLRWVNTATGEVLVARSVEGSTRSAKEIFELERRLAVDVLAPAIETTLGTGTSPGDSRKQLDDYLKRKAGVVAGARGYGESLVESGKALSLETAGDYKAAATAWQRVLSLDPTNKHAQVRGKTLLAYAKAEQ